MYRTYFFLILELFKHVGTAQLVSLNTIFRKHWRTETGGPNADMVSTPACLQHLAFKIKSYLLHCLQILNISVIAVFRHNVIGLATQLGSAFDINKINND